MQPSKIWADVLAKMTQSALEGGFKMLFDATEGAKFVEYPPNALQFRDLCYRQHASLNLPKQEDVRRDIDQYETHDQLPARTHVIVRYIAAGLPDDYFESDDLQKKQAYLNDVYKKARELALSGHEIPAVNVKSRKKPSSQTIARQNLNAMYALLGARPKQVAVAC